MSILLVFFLIAVGTQFLFWVAVFGRFAFSFREKNTTEALTKPISVLICARNECHNLEKYLPLWLTQQYFDYEVVVVNDRSTDGTDLVLTKFAKRYERLRFMRINNKPENYDGKKYAIEQGLRLANHDLILLSDADCYPKSATNIARRAIQFDDNIDFVIGYSPYETQKTWLNILIQYETIYTALQYFSMAYLGNPYMGVGRNLGYNQQLFWKNKGFNKYKHLTGGDDDLFVNRYAHKHNTRLVIHEDSQVVSIPETNWKSWWRQKKRHLSVGKSYRLGDKIWLGFLTGSQITLWSCFFIGLFRWENTELMCSLAFILVRQICVYVVFQRFLRQLRGQLSLKNLFIIEFVYIAYYFCTGIISLISKKTAWKKRNEDSFQKKH